jgi:hypothetical protein
MKIFIKYFRHKTPRGTPGKARAEMPPNPQHLRPQPPWPKGVSGNPKGRPPKGQAFADLLELIESTPGARNAISKVWLQKILKGDFKYFQEYVERMDGKVPAAEPEPIELPEIIDQPEPDETDNGAL